MTTEIEIAPNQYQFTVAEYHQMKEVKLPLYAESGIPEVWIVNLKSSCVEVYTGPQQGSYSQLQTLKRGQVVTPQQIPLLVKVNELMG
ncbi:MAG: Uma2 family endonuclease [Cytophagales bacterium]|nr:MAG: Uma2 family endonuclease [Cytophagales bacterium]